MSANRKKTLVTGATGGLGEPVVRFFLNAGHTVIASSRRKESLEELYEKNENLILAPADVNDKKSIDEALKKIINRIHSIDILINIAGGFSAGKTIIESNLDEWDKMINLNLRSAFLMSKLVLPHMVKQRSGKIINISAMSAFNPQPKRSAYTVSKAALNTLTECLAAEGKPYNIQVNAIAPSIIATESNRKAMPDADQSTWVSPEQIAQTMLYLCSDHSNDVTGTIIKMPGGV